ncbi:MAG: CvpA family protein [Oscillospiraceae bacterium]|jgi:uncharacterized membrane protein required for colicin V production|nr:CvpA family protein [Oscillospiraceae bacterium]
MTGFLIDLLLIAAMAFCVWQGFRKGLFLTVAGVVVIFIAAYFAGKAAAAYAGPVSEKLAPIMSWLAEDAIYEATRGRGRINEMTDAKEIAEVARRTFETMGVSGVEIDAMIDKVLLSLAETEQTVQETISVTVLYVAAYALLCLFAFILFLVGLTLLIHFLAAVFKLPGLHLVDKIGGAAAGALYGVLILCAVGWAVRYLGIVAGPELVENTTVLKLFVNHNMLAGMLSFKPAPIL